MRDPFSEDNYARRTVTPREQEDARRAMQEKIIEQRETLARMGFVAPRGSSPASSSFSSPPVTTPLYSRNHLLRGGANEKYPMFSVRRSPSATQIVDARLNPLVCFLSMAAYVRLRQHRYVLQANTELRCLVTGQDRQPSTICPLADWEFICKAGGMYRAPPSEQPEMLVLCALPEHCFVGELAGALVLVLRYAKMDNDRLHMLLNGASNEDVALQQLGLEDCSEDIFTSWVEDHMRVVLVLQVAPSEAGTPTLYQLFSYYFTL